MLIVDVDELLLSLFVESLLLGNGLHPGKELDDVVAIGINTVPESFELAGPILVVGVRDAVVAFEPVNTVTVV